MVTKATVSSQVDSNLMHIHPDQAKKTRQQSRDTAAPVEEFQPFSDQPENAGGPETSGRQSSDIREVPEVINQRMLNRMLTFSLLPVFLGFASLPLLAYIQASDLCFLRLPHTALKPRGIFLSGLKLMESLNPIPCVHASMPE